ncbi:hypothetical protein HPB50_020073 [Hyalomma asiaticum]|uniref:Uncharacterized protein n=1 Tax=Hyalomma asiaticum TaxID=266040 RepID=A0ACB7SAC0_HYAAI|nr:hypothetical protein HPB50_020073 [Hyalomma asiaticum]
MPQGARISPNLRQALHVAAASGSHIAHALRLRPHGRLPRSDRIFAHNATEKHSDRQKSLQGRPVGNFSNGAAGESERRIEWLLTARFGLHSEGATTLRDRTLLRTALPAESMAATVGESEPVAAAAAAAGGSARLHGGGRKGLGGARRGAARPWTGFRADVSFFSPAAQPRRLGDCAVITGGQEGGREREREVDGGCMLPPTGTKGVEERKKRCNAKPDREERMEARGWAGLAPRGGERTCVQLTATGPAAQTA